MRVVELFAGVGGFRVGLEAASPAYRTVWADQWEPGSKAQFAYDCYASHFDGTGSMNLNEDIALVKGQVPEHDLLCGGFPCQDYSVATTKAHGIEGKKGVLWWHINDIVNSKHPSFVFLENVDRLLKSPTSQRGRDFAIILRCLADAGYYVEWRVINAADYGFVQKRRRTYIFAARNDTQVAKAFFERSSKALVTKDGFFAGAFPVHETVVKGRSGEYDLSGTNFETLQNVSDEFAAAFYNSGAMKGHRVYTQETAPAYGGEYTLLQNILQRDAPERFIVEGSALDKWKEMKGSKKIERVNKVTGYKYLYSEGAIPFPDPIDRPGRTMLTSEGSPNRSSHLILDPETGKYRKLTPMECERMNGFPDNWTDCMTDRQRYFTMGNALVVGIVEKMGIRLADLMQI